MPLGNMRLASAAVANTKLRGKKMVNTLEKFAKTPAENPARYPVKAKKKK